MAKKLALITGATSGIGAAYATKLASLQYDLILTGRRGDEINSLANKIREEYKVNVEVIIIELADDLAVAQLIERIKQLSNLEILINNAGYTVKGLFKDGNIRDYENMLKVHSLVTMQLTQAALPSMLQNKSGSIINVSSILAFIPYRYCVVYCATKAFINLFTESLFHELKGSGVRLQVLCPGLTRSDFHKKIGINIDEAYGSRGKLWQPMLADAVVEKSLKDLARNKLICVPGFLNKLSIILVSLKRLLC